MKTYFLLSEAVQIALISSIGGIIIVILGFIFPLLTKIFNKQIEIRDGQVESHKQMDGMKDELVKTTAELARVKGIMEGRAEMKQELDIDISQIEKITHEIAKIKEITPNPQAEINRLEIEKLKLKVTSEPQSVVITNPEPLPVVVKK